MPRKGSKPIPVLHHFERVDVPSYTTISQLMQLALRVPVPSEAYLAVHEGYDGPEIVIEWPVYREPE